MQVVMRASLKQVHTSPSYIMNFGRHFASVTPTQASIEPHPEVEGVFTLTFNRPEAKNSLGNQLMKQLRESLQSQARASTLPVD